MPDTLDRIIDGSHTPVLPITCQDGFTVHILAGPRSFSLPAAPPYTHLEVVLPSRRPQPWDEWLGYALEYREEDTPPDPSVFASVPVEIVRQLLDAHGGEQR